MKKIISPLIGICGYSSVFTVSAQAQDWNPFLSQGIVAPAPLSPAEFGGTGTLSLLVGNTGSSDMVLVTGQEMLVNITLSRGVPNNVNPLAAISGAGAAWFNWSYNPANRTYSGVQNQTIPGNLTSTVVEAIFIAYKVTENTFVDQTPQNGFNANLTPPGYTNDSNASDDDSVSDYTYVSAYDHSDAPASYAAVSHEVNLRKDASNLYLSFMHLGAAVDPETAAQASPPANGDDANQTGGLNLNDDDGVVFPTMTPGTVVTIPVTVTLWDWDPENPPATATLRGWIDWNKDNVYTNTATPTGERVFSLDVSTYLSDEGEPAWTGPRTFVIPFSVTVPPTATGTYNARFRFGPTVTPVAALASHGEVEDYMIFVGTTSGTVTGRIYHDVNGNGAKNSTEPYLPNISVTVTDASNNPQTVVTDANGYWFALVPAGNATVDINNADPDLPPGTALSQGTDPRSVTILSRQNIDGGIAGFGPAGYMAWKAKNNTSGAMDQDHDHDCVPNGIEYFLVGPQGNSTGFTTLPSIQKPGGVMSITWTKASTYTGTYNTHFVVETSTNLQNPWTPEPLGTYVTINGNQITYTFPQPYLNKKFVRLRVSGP